jgi:NAD(P)-dependent dehydrogenase (short-subunit alcohol dehydrogenase family)
MNNVRNCLITGTSSGIGYATALRLARGGIHVHATMRNLEKGAPLRDAANTEGLPISCHALDVTDQSSISEVVTKIGSESGPIDAVINNAGLSNACPLEIYPEDEHRALFETNYWGPIRLIQAILPGMRNQKHGAIVNISSILGKVAVVNQAAYCASKFAVEAFSESLALEVAPMGIRVVIIEPGVIATPIFNKTPMHYNKQSPYRQAMRQSGRFYKSSIPQATPADELAETIWESITTDKPRLRWLHGHGESLVKRRPNVPDEEYIAISSLEDDAYNTRFEELFAMDLRPKEA